jgi:hypothetical protein
VAEDAADNRTDVTKTDAAGTKTAAATFVVQVLRGLVATRARRTGMDGTHFHVVL